MNHERTPRIAEPADRTGLVQQTPHSDGHPAATLFYERRQTGQNLGRVHGSILGILHKRLDRPEFEEHRSCFTEVCLAHVDSARRRKRGAIRWLEIY